MNLMYVIEPVAIPKVATVLAESLRTQILDGRIATGQTLPNERELALRAGVSRPSVREALRILEVEGLVITRAGRGGGAEVVKPDISMIERSMDTFIRGTGIQLQSMVEARVIIEPGAAELAARRWDDADWTDLKDHHERLLNALHDLRRFLKANLDWHQSVIRASHNELMIAFTSSIAQPMYASTDLRGFNTIAVRQAVYTAHSKVMDALYLRDSNAARRRMNRHVHAYSERISRRAVGDPLLVESNHGDNL